MSLARLMSMPKMKVNPYTAKDKKQYDMHAEPQVLISDNTEARQVLGFSSFADALLENRKLPSNYHCNFTVSHESNEDNNPLSDFRKGLENYRAGKIQADLAPHPLSYREKIRLLFQSMPNKPGARGPAENWAFFITYPNFIFLYLISTVGFICKAIGDGLIGLGHATVKFLLQKMAKDKQGKRHWLACCLALIFFIPAVALAVALGFIAQRLFFFFNVINYIRQLFDGITNVVVYFMALLITCPFLNDKADYTDLSYSLHVIARNALLLAPIALVIAVCIVPFAGPVGGFVSNVVMHVGFTSAAGAINFAIFYALLISYHLFAATVQFIDTIMLQSIAFLVGETTEPSSEEQPTAQANVIPLRVLNVTSGRDLTFDTATAAPAVEEFSAEAEPERQSVRAGM